MPTFKASRKATRTCHSCKNIISKGSLYTQRSITLGSKKDGLSQSFDGSTITVHQLRIKVDICQTCSNN